MARFDSGVVGELTVTPEEMRKTVGHGRYWPREAGGLRTGAWSYDGEWMPPGAPKARRDYPWRDTKSPPKLGRDEPVWSTAQRDASAIIFRIDSLRRPRTASATGPLALDGSAYNPVTGLPKSTRLVLPIGDTETMTQFSQLTAFQRSESRHRFLRAPGVFRSTGSMGPAGW